MAKMASLRNRHFSIFCLGFLGILSLLLLPGHSWARGGGGCLEEGTLIQTPAGSISIERLAAGNTVWSLSARGRKPAVVQSVVRVEPKEYLELSLESGRLRVTAEHPVMTAPGVFRRADNLRPGEKVIIDRDGVTAAVPVLTVQRTAGRRTAYNLLVSPGGTFLAGDIVLHNKGCFLPDSPILRVDGSEVMISAIKRGDRVWAFAPDGRLVPTEVLSVMRHQAEEYIRLHTDRVTLRVTPEHPFYIGNGTFKTVEALRPGDTVLAFDGKWLAKQKIRSLETVRERVEVFNLQTDQPHTFFAHGVAVHNKGGCFPAGTEIATATGSKPIDGLTAGDEVLAVDPDGRIVPTRIKTIFIQKSPLVEIRTRSGSLRTTADHPIALETDRFRPAGHLRSGQRVNQWLGGRLKTVPVRTITAEAGERLVFNLEVEAPHTFIAEGVVVHNKGGGCLPSGTPVWTTGGEIPIEALAPGAEILSVGPRGAITPTPVEKIFKTGGMVLDLVTDCGTLRSTADHPVGTPEGGFIAAGDLGTGRQVLFLKNGELQPATVLRRIWEERPQPVYNLTVGGPHTFLASGFLTHNKGGGSSRSSGSRSSGGGGSGKTTLAEAILLFVFMGIFITIFLVVLISAASRSSKNKNENLDYVYPRKKIDPKAVKTEKLLTFLGRQDPAVSAEALRSLAEATFVQLQDCWGKREYGPMQPLLLPDLFNQHTAQLEGLRRNHEINRIDDLKIERIDLVHIRYTEKPEQREFTALITASALDYYQDDRSGKFLRGDRTPARFQEFWTFQWLDGRWLLREIEQAGESDLLKEENFVESLTDDTLKGIYEEEAESQGKAGPWLEKEVGRKADRIDRLLNFLSRTDRIWDRTQMLKRAREIFMKVYLGRESGDPARIPAENLFPGIAADQKTRMEIWNKEGLRVEYRNLCVRKVELLLVRNYADNTRDEFTVRISAHAQRIVRRGEQVVNSQEYVTPFEEYWTFGRLDGQWQLKEILPPGRGKGIVDLENLDEDSSPGQLQWYYRQPRAI